MFSRRNFHKFTTQKYGLSLHEFNELNYFFWPYYPDNQDTDPVSLLSVQLNFRRRVSTLNNEFLVGIQIIVMSYLICMNFKLL